MPCDSFTKLYQDNEIADLSTCETATDKANGTTLASSTNATSSNTTDSAQSSGHSGKELSTGAKVGLNIGTGIACGLLSWLLFILIFRRGASCMCIRVEPLQRRRKAPQSAQAISEADGAEVEGAAMLGTGSEKHELAQPSEELPAGVMAQESLATHGETEL